MQDDCQNTSQIGNTPDASPVGPLITQAVQVAEPHGLETDAMLPMRAPANATTPDPRAPLATAAAQRAAPARDDTANAEAQQAQQALLRTVYEENLTAVYRFIYGKVGAREEAEDLTSQVFMKALRGLDRARDPQSIQKWLFQVARTTVADHWRAYYRLPSRSLDDLLDAGWEGPSDSDHAYRSVDAADDDADDDAAAPDGPAAPGGPAAEAVDASLAALMASGAAAGGGSDEARAHRILALLPPRYREVLTYRFLLNYSLKETAAQMQVTEANVKVLQFRALKKASQMEFPSP